MEATTNEEEVYRPGRAPRLASVPMAIPTADGTPPLAMQHCCRPTPSPQRLVTPDLYQCLDCGRERANALAARHMSPNEFAEVGNGIKGGWRMKPAAVDDAPEPPLELAVTLTRPCCAQWRGVYYRTEWDALSRLVTYRCKYCDDETRKDRAHGLTDFYWRPGSRDEAPDLPDKDDMTAGPAIKHLKWY